MEWSGQKDFTAASTVSFSVDGKEAGQLKSHGPLAFLKVKLLHLHIHFMALILPDPNDFRYTKCTSYSTNISISMRQVHDAGHMVPMDQPKAALEMLKQWTQGTLASTDKTDELSTV